MFQLCVKLGLKMKISENLNWIKLELRQYNTDVQ